MRGTSREERHGKRKPSLRALLAGDEWSLGTENLLNCMKRHPDLMASLALAASDGGKDLMPATDVAAMRIEAFMRRAKRGAVADQKWLSRSADVFGLIGNLDEIDWLVIAAYGFSRFDMG